MTTFSVPITTLGTRHGIPVSKYALFHQIYLVVELCTNGSLHQYLKQRHSSLLSQIIRQLGDIGSMALPEEMTTYHVS